MKQIKKPEQIREIEDSKVESEAKETIAELPTKFNTQDTAPKKKRRLSRDVLGLDLALLPQTRMRSHEVFPTIQPTSSCPQLIKKRRLPPVRKPVQTHVVGRINNSFDKELYEVYETMPSDAAPSRKKRRGSAPDTPTRRKRDPSVSPSGTPFSNQKLLRVAPKSPSSSPNTDKQKQPPSGEINKVRLRLVLHSCYRKQKVLRSPNQPWLSLTTNLLTRRHLARLNCASHQDTTSHLANHHRVPPIPLPDLLQEVFTIFIALLSF